MANIKMNCDKMEAEKDNKKVTTTTNNTDLTSALRNGKGAEGPKQEQVPLLNKTQKEEREEEAQKQEKKQEQEQQEQQQQEQQQVMGWW